VTLRRTCRSWGEDHSQANDARSEEEEEVMRQRAEGDNKCKQDEMSPAGIVRRTFDARCQRDRQKDQQRVGAQFRPVIDELPPECDEDARESRGPWADHGARVDDDRCGGNRCEGGDKRRRKRHKGDDPCVAEVPETRWLV
jgi:hypothetical protein